MSSRNSIDKITDKNALSIGESIGWKKLVGQVELPKLSCELSGSKGREHSEDYIPKFTLSFSHILESVMDRRSHENQVVGIELAFEALSLGGLIHFAFAKIDI